MRARFQAYLYHNKSLINSTSMCKVWLQIQQRTHHLRMEASLRCSLVMGLPCKIQATLTRLAKPTQSQIYRTVRTAKEGQTVLVQLQILILE